MTKWLGSGAKPRRRGLVALGVLVGILLGSASLALGNVLFRQDPASAPDPSQPSSSAVSPTATSAAQGAPVTPSPGSTLEPRPSSSSAFEPPSIATSVPQENPPDAEPDESLAPEPTELPSDASTDRPAAYTVTIGDSLSVIADSFGVTVDELRDANNIPDDRDQIYPGTQLIIP